MAFKWFPMSNRRRWFILTVTLAIVSVVLFSYTYRLILLGVLHNTVPKTFKSERIEIGLNMRYNLLGEAAARLIENPDGFYDDTECNLDNINEFRLQQDHPCVISLIRRLFLKSPSPLDVPYRLDHPEIVDQSAIQTGVILKHLENQTNGFFIECGALDGETGSNTLYMERSLGWSGILIEADPDTYKKLADRGRKSWNLPVCLSPKPYPIQVNFHVNSIAGKIFNSEDEGEKDNKNTTLKDGRLATVQCFPLYSILLAVGQTRIDYFSLDVEGSETDVLTSVPWHKIFIKSLTVEVTSRKVEIRDALARYMQEQGFINAGLLDGWSYYDLVFVHEKNE